MNNRLAKIVITNQLLLDMFHFPEGTEFLRAETTWDYSQPDLAITITHPDINEVQEGHKIPTIRPTFTSEYDEAAHLVDVKLTDWGQHE